MGYRSAYRAARRPAYPGSNAAHYPSDILTPPAPPPGTPEIWYSSRDVDLLVNATMTDGMALGTWKNKGAVGAGGDALQAVAGSKPLFKALAALGKLNNAPSVAGNGSRWMQTAALTNIPQPNMTVAVVRYNASGTVTCDGSAAARHVIYTNPFWSLYAGAGPVSSARDPSENTYQQLNVLWNGASTVMRTNKSAIAGFGSPGAHGSDMITLFANFDGTGGLDGELVEFLLYGTPPAAGDVEAWLDTAFGGSWPQ